MVRFGACLWAHGTDWPALRDAALAAEGAGFDSLWTDDHLVNDMGDPAIPVFEAWTTLAAWAVLTVRPTLGLLVGAPTLRSPALIAKLATTLDHISGGRAILGLGTGWFEPEFRMFGIEAGGLGDRHDRLDEAADLIRRLLDGETVTHTGGHVRLDGAHLEPPPVQARLPILIGGSGPRRTLRTVARVADAWNMPSGSVGAFVERDAVLRRHCAAIGRDPATIERTAMFYVAVRDDPAAAADVLAHTTARFTGTLEDEPLTGTPDDVADRLRPYLAAGLDHVMWAFYAPFDLETIGRLGEVRARLEAPG